VISCLIASHLIGPLLHRRPPPQPNSRARPRQINRGRTTSASCNGGSQACWLGKPVPKAGPRTSGRPQDVRVPKAGPRMSGWPQDVRLAPGCQGAKGWPQDVRQVQRLMQLLLHQTEHMQLKHSLWLSASLWRSAPEAWRCWAVWGTSVVMRAAWMARSCQR